MEVETITKYREDGSLDSIREKMNEKRFDLQIVCYCFPEINKKIFEYYQYNEQIIGVGKCFNENQTYCWLNTKNKNNGPFIRFKYPLA